MIVAAPGSGHGKTTVTLGLLAGLQQAGWQPAAAKAGPDYIDPGYHEALTGRRCPNLDPHAMRAATRQGLLAQAGDGGDLVVVEGVMGLFDGPAEAPGTTAALARETGLPVVLVVDAAGMGASLGALAAGFAQFDPRLELAGVIANRVASPRHAALLEAGCGQAGVPLLAALPRDSELAIPSGRHGLAPASAALAGWGDRLAGWLAPHLDLNDLARRARPLPNSAARPDLPPPGQRVAVARDAAFAFAYPWLLDAWHAAGAELVPFAPLADEAPEAACDAVFLPGGWPESHAGSLAAATAFKAGLAEARDRGAAIYGECGGFMALGETLTDAQGLAHPMAGLLPVATSVESPRLRLGYRRVVTAAAVLGWAAGTPVAAHRFHYARRTDRSADLPPAFLAADGSAGEGVRLGSVAGSFLHLIDAARPAQTASLPAL